MGKNEIYNLKLKQQFLEENCQNNETKRISLHRLKPTSEYEKLLGKDVFNFTREERLGLLSKYGAKSIASLESVHSLIRSYCKWAWNKGISIYDWTTDEISFDDLKNHLDKYAINNSYFKTPEDFYNFIKQLVNCTDRAILVCFYEGLWGSKGRENGYSEIRNLKQDDLVIAENKLIIRTDDDSEIIKRIVEIKEESMKILVAATEDDEYYLMNGETTKKVPTLKLHESDYVIRATQNSACAKFSPDLISQRIVNMQNWTENPFLNAKNLFKSGQLHWCRERYEQNGEITIKDFKECVCFYKQSESTYISLQRLYNDVYDIK